MKNLIIGYIVISIIVGIIFLLSTILYKRISKKINMTYILSSISLLVVLTLEVLYRGEFLTLGTWANLNGFTTVFQVLVAAIPAAVLTYLASPKMKNISLREDVLTGMAMEIPMRALVQNLFVVFGATAVVFRSVTNSILLTAIIWVQFIMFTELMTKKSISSKVILESMASIWFSIWVGILYLSTGSIILAMLTHGLERWIAYMIRSSNIVHKELRTSV